MAPIPHNPLSYVVLMAPIDQSHKSQNALHKYPLMHHFVTEMCTHVHILLQMMNCGIWDWYIVGYWTVKWWDMGHSGIMNLVYGLPGHSVQDLARRPVGKTTPGGQLT